MPFLPDLGDRELEELMLEPFREALRQLVNQAAPNLLREVIEPILEKCNRDAEGLAKAMLSELITNIDANGLQIIVTICGEGRDFHEIEVPADSLRNIILRGCGGQEQPHGKFRPHRENLDQFISEFQALIDDLKQIETYPPRI